MKKEPRAFLSRNRICCLARIYASTPELVAKRVQMFTELADIVSDLKFEGIPIVKKIVAIVPTNPAYSGASRLDCGLTAAAIERTCMGRGNIEVVEVKFGGPFCTAFNEVMTEKIVQRYTHAFIFSAEARKSINLPTMLANIEAHIKGALYSGVAFDDLTPRVKAGHVMNTWAFLNIREAISVGGFHPFAEMAENELAQYTITAVKDGKKYSYPVQGCEEGPLIHALYSKHCRPCTAVIDPIDEAGKPCPWKYIPATPEDEKRHEEKIATKKKRLLALMYRCSQDPSYLWNALLPEYRDERYKDRDAESETKKKPDVADLCSIRFLNF